MQELPADSGFVPPQPGAVLVLERWNSWVRVLDPISGASGWVNLAEVEHEVVSTRPRSEPSRISVRDH